MLNPYPFALPRYPICHSHICDRRSRKHTDREAFLQEIGNRYYSVTPLRFLQIPFGVKAYLMSCIGGVAGLSAIALNPHSFVADGFISIALSLDSP